MRGPKIVRWTTKSYFINTFLRLDAGHRVLDIGCGLGEFTILAARRAREVVGVDAAETAVTAARLAASRLGVDNVEFAVGNAYELVGVVGEPESFDRVLCLDLIEHVSEPQKVMAQIHALLRPGGRALVYTNCYGRFSWVYLKECWRTRGRPGRLWASDARDHHLHRFTLPELRELTAPFHTRLVFKNHFLIPFASWLTRRLNMLLAPTPPAGEPASSPEASSKTAVTVQETMRAPRRVAEVVKWALSIAEMETLGRFLPSAGAYLLLEKR